MRLSFGDAQYCDGKATVHTLGLGDVIAKHYLQHTHEKLQYHVIRMES